MWYLLVIFGGKMFRQIIAYLSKYNTEGFLVNVAHERVLQHFMDGQ